MALTDRQSALIEVINQVSQNLTSNNLVSAGLDINLGLGGGISKPSCPASPKNIRDVLLNLVNEQVQVTTPFGAITGTLLSVKQDYIVILETSGDQVLVRIDKIEFINEL